MNPIVSEVLMAEDVPASVLVAAMVDGLGIDALGYEPEVIRDWFKGKHGIRLSQDNVDKIIGLQTIYNSDGFYKDLTIFRVTCDALAGEGITGVSDMPHVEDIAWAVNEAEMHDPETAASTEFTPEIKAFVRVLLGMSGFSTPPSGLEFAGTVDANAVSPTDLTGDPEALAALTEALDERLGDVNSYVAEQVIRVLSDVDKLDLGVDKSSWEEYNSRFNTPPEAKQKAL